MTGMTFQVRFSIDSLIGRCSEPIRYLVLAMETFGAESLNEAVKADKTVVLDGIKSIAKSLGSTKVSEACLPAIKDHPGGVVSKVCHDTESIKGESYCMTDTG